MLKMIEETFKKTKRKSFFQRGFLVILFVGVCLAIAIRYVNQSTFDEIDLKSYTASVVSEQSGSDYKWSVEDYEGLDVNEGGKNGVSLSDVMERYGQPSSSSMITSGASQNRISLVYETNNLYHSVVTLMFKEVEGQFYLYEKSAFGLSYGDMTDSVDNSQEYLWTKLSFQSLQNKISVDQVVETFGKPSTAYVTAHNRELYLHVLYQKSSNPLSSESSVNLLFQKQGRQFILTDKNATNF